MRIDFATAAELILNYKVNQWQTLNDNCQALQNPDGTAKEDSRSVWFSIGELQNYLSDVENAGGSGVRIYFGAYDNAIIDDAIDVLKKSDPSFIPEMAQYNGMHTVVMVPTIDLAGRQTDFSLDPQVVGFEDTNSVKLSCLNHGSMAPPPWKDITNAAGNADPSFFRDNCGAALLDL